MEIRPLSRIGNLPTQPYDAGQLVAATRALNHAQSLGQRRSLRLRRGAGGKRLRVQVVDRDTGEVMDELPPEAILRMMNELEKQREGDR
jgi:uncharacterized FlaG/YvyC family protein